MKTVNKILLISFLSALCFSGHAQFRPSGYSDLTVKVDNNIDSLSVHLDSIKSLDFRMLNISSLWSLSGSYLYPTTLTDSIGIGTSSPTEKLHVVGNLRLTGSYKDSNNEVGTNGQILSTTGTGTDWINAPSAPTLADVTANGSTTTGDITINGQIPITGTGGSVFIGEGAGEYDDLSDNKNVAIGFQSLYSNIIGSQNAANGTWALYFNTEGSYNTANGSQSLYFNTIGSFNTANGANSIQANTEGNYNTANGFQSLASNTEGNGNTANGYCSGYYLADGITGRESGDNGLYLGLDTKASANGTVNEIAIGYDAIGQGSNSVMLGSSSITKTILNGDVGIGTTSPTQSLHVVGNILVNTNGTEALISTHKGTNSDGYNIFIGNGGLNSQAFIFASTGSYNTSLGYNSLYDNTCGSNNTASGYFSLNSNTSGSDNTSNGSHSLNSNTSGNYNTAIGVYSLGSNTTGEKNVANGCSSLYYNTVGSCNTANGYYSLLHNIEGSGNTANGYNAGRYIANETTNKTTGDYGLYLGYDTRASADSTTNEMVIGANAIGNGSNTATIGDDNVTDVWMGENGQANVHAGSMYNAIKTITANYTTTANDYSIIVNSVSATTTTLLSSSATTGQTIRLFNKGTGSATVSGTFTGYGSSATMPTGGSMIIQFDGLSWTPFAENNISW